MTKTYNKLINLVSNKINTTNTLNKTTLNKSKNKDVGFKFVSKTNYGGKMFVSKNNLKNLTEKHIDKDFRPRDLNCLFNEEKIYFIQILKSVLQKLLISFVYRVSF